MFWNWDLLVQACSTQMKVLDRWISFDQNGLSTDVFLVC
jgi:hypothetical protein